VSPLSSVRQVIQSMWYSLTILQRTHTGPKPYSCDFFVSHFRRVRFRACPRSLVNNNCLNPFGWTTCCTRYTGMVYKAYSDRLLVHCQTTCNMINKYIIHTYQYNIICVTLWQQVVILIWSYQSAVCNTRNTREYWENNSIKGIDQGNSV